MKAGEDDKPYDDLNITPMVDLLFVLVVMFILLCIGASKGVNVKLPSGGSASKSLSAQKVQAISVNQEGKMFLNSQPVSPEELRSRLGSYKSANPNMQVVVKGDSVAHYQAVMDVLNVVGELGISQVGLATKTAAK